MLFLIVGQVAIQIAHESIELVKALQSSVVVRSNSLLFKRYDQKRGKNRRIYQKISNKYFLILYFEGYVGQIIHHSIEKLISQRIICSSIASE